MLVLQRINNTKTSDTKIFLALLMHRRAGLHIATFESGPVVTSKSSSVGSGDSASRSHRRHAETLGVSGAIQTGKKKD